MRVIMIPFLVAAVLFLQSCESKPSSEVTQNTENEQKQNSPSLQKINSKVPQDLICAVLPTQLKNLEMLREQNDLIEVSINEDGIDRLKAIKNIREQTYKTFRYLDELLQDAVNDEDFKKNITKCKFNDPKLDYWKNETNAIYGELVISRDKVLDELDEFYSRSGIEYLKQDFFNRNLFYDIKDFKINAVVLQIIEWQTLLFLLEQKCLMIIGGENKLSFDKFDIINEVNTSYIKKGQDYETFIALGTYSSQAKFNVYVNNEKLKVVDGKALYKTKAQVVGKRSYNVKISVSNPLTGETETFEKNYYYTVVE